LGHQHDRKAGKSGPEAPRRLICLCRIVQDVFLHHDDGEVYALPSDDSTFKTHLVLLKTKGHTSKRCGPLGSPLRREGVVSEAVTLADRAISAVDQHFALLILSEWGKPTPDLLEQSIRQANGYQVTLLTLSNSAVFLYTEDEAEDDRWSPPGF
jgi:hypothetical protein